MSTPSPSTSPWRKSSRSTNTGGDCVEIALLTHATGRREPKLS
ncbi:DUF397 domain-containing protein [Actinoallomurus sp. CA-150999]